MGHLGGEGDHFVVFFRCGDGEEAKIAGLQGILHPLKQGNVIKHRGDQHHGRAVEQIRPAVLKAGELGACHGVSAHKGKAILLRYREAALADLLLDAAAVQYQSVFGDKVGVLFQPGGAAVRVDGQKDQIAFRDGGFVQLSVDGSCQHGKGQHGFVALDGVNGVAFQGVGSGKRAADQPEAENSYIHTRTSRICWTFRFSSSNWGGVRDWAPSHRAQAGLLWTSTMMPSAPAAVAA